MSSLLRLGALLGLLPLLLGAGRIEGVVFDRATGLPQSGLELRVDDLIAVTDAAGAFSFELEAGQHVVQLEGGESPPVEVVDGEISELLLTLEGDGTLQARIEAPAPTDEAERLTEIPAGPPGSLDGVVRSAEDGRTISNARIFVRGLDLETRTDEDGRFAVELPPGSWGLSIVRTGWSTGTASDVAITSGEETTLAIELFPAAAQLEEFTVVAPRIDGATSTLLDERRSSDALSDVLGAEQMAASGDSSAAGALKRVTGLTLLGGRYVYVRGLGERYSATTMNGANLPSPEPERRVVPLDLFPTAVLESVVIQKTFTPEMPAEFGGGVIQLRTRSVPDQPIARLSLSGGVRTGSTGTQALGYDGGPSDWLGIDGGYRSLPEAVAEASSNSPLEARDMFSEQGYTREELEAFGEAMPNRWNTTRQRLAPDYGISLTLGNGITNEDGRAFGALVGVGYGAKHDSNVFDRSYYLVGANDALERSHTYVFETGERRVRLGGIVVVGARPHPDHSITSTTLLTRNTDDETRVYEGLNRDVDAAIRVTRLRYVERMLLTQQVVGAHTFPVAEALHVDWRYTWSQARRDEPDRREYRYDFEDSLGVWLLSDRPEGNQRFFSSLLDEAHDFGGGITLEFPQWSGQIARVRLGGSYLSKERTVDTRRFKYVHRGPLTGDPDVISQSPEEIFTPDNIGNDGFQFEEITRQTDNYRAAQTIGAAYASIELPLHERVRLSGGVRIERSNQVVETFELFNPDNEPVNAQLRTTDVLPGFNGVFELRDDMQLRVGYGMTVSRPDFRELSPATFNDVTGGRQTFGNPDLQRARIHGVDLRWEWYPTPSESISAAVFYKRLISPIETIVVVSAQHSVTWENAEAADNVGTELEVRKDFAFAHPALADLYFAGNLSLVWSRVSLGENAGIQTSNERALQGQSPFVLNAQLGYDNPDTGTQLSLLYNVFGRRIGAVGALGAPDTYQEAFHQLDFVARQRLGRSGLSLGLTVKNILNSWQRESQGDQETERYRSGVSFGLKLSWNAVESFRRRSPEAR